MLAPLRRHLRRIHYYSAAREATPWSRAADRLLFAALLLALPAAMICDAAVTRSNVAMEVDGMLVRNSGGAGVTADLAKPPAAWTPATMGSFIVRVLEDHRGWPFVTSTSRRPATIEYNLYDEPEPRIDTGREVDAPLRSAIERGLERESRAELLHFLTRRSPLRANESLWRWFFAAGAWWMLLYGAGMVALTSARLGMAVHERREAAISKRRLRTGKCQNCGYDLRGTEYSARCPECGEPA